jgi:hypothetical protein
MYNREQQNAQDQGYETGNETFLETGSICLKEDDGG